MAPPRKTPRTRNKYDKTSLTIDLREGMRRQLEKHAARKKQPLGAEIRERLAASLAPAKRDLQAAE